jgi:hypothetical protein
VCRSVADCSDGEKCINNKCMVSCITHSQCQGDQACVSGGCILGCRSNKNCVTTESCINNKCQGMLQTALNVYFIFNINIDIEFFNILIY